MTTVAPMPEWFEAFYDSYERAQIDWVRALDEYEPLPMHEPIYESYQAAVEGEAQLYATLGLEHDDAVDMAIRWARKRGYVVAGRPRSKAVALQTRDRFERVKQAVLVESLAGRLTDLTWRGDVGKGLCPFHPDRVPSFVVWPKTRSWRCFGACATGGDVIALAQQAMDRRLM